MSQDLTGTPRKSIPWGWIATGIGVVVVASMLGLKAIEGTVTYYIQTDEFVSQRSQWLGKNVKVAGWVKEGTYTKEGNRLHRFDVRYGEYSFPVEYRGLVPDTFKEGAEVVVEGKANESPVFNADTLMAKCASKYEVGDLPPVEQRVKTPDSNSPAYE